MDDESKMLLDAACKKMCEEMMINDHKSRGWLFALRSLFRNIRAGYKVRKVTPKGTSAMVSPKLAAHIDQQEKKPKVERYQVAKRQTRYTYRDGPMCFLGQQIVKAMEDAGYPAKIHTCYRSAATQRKLFHKRVNGRRVTRANAYQSAHQYYEAVDIVHPSLFWNASADYWEQLAQCVRIVAEKYGVDLNHGHHWSWVDSAHIELRDWHIFKARVGDTHPTPVQLAERFEEVLPAVWKQYKRSAAYKAASAD